MIKIKKSETADSRTCDFKDVTKATLHKSSVRHINDVRSGIEFFVDMLRKAGSFHDHDKLSDIDGFYADFITGFESRSWWNQHKRLNRHHDYRLCYGWNGKIWVSLF